MQGVAINLASDNKIDPLAHYMAQKSSQKSRREPQQQRQFE
jgi:hypothetical protein